MKRIAIIGAGLTGIRLAQRLTPYANVTIFEQNDTPGGRLASHQISCHEFDYGAQFFTARTPAFQQWLAPYLDHQSLAIWQGHFAEIDKDRIINRRLWQKAPAHYVGFPSMKAWAQTLVTTLTVIYSCEICSIAFDKVWTLTDQKQNTYTGFDWVIIACPLARCRLLAPKICAFYDTLNTLVMKSCFTLMLSSAKPLRLPFQAALIRNNDISWISNNSSKPGRTSETNYLVVHASNRFADQHKNPRHLDQIKQHLLQVTATVIKTPLSQLTIHHMHHWKEANISKQPSHHTCIDTTLQLAAVGDWCQQGIAEAAFTQANRLSDTLLSHL